ncbi:MAG: DUF4402 domain-containing protein [Holophagales bacterium]|nr:DUF4402 domain-containing protein [Holophagales bacterium]
MKRLRAALALTLLVSAIGIGAPKAQAQSGTVDVGVNVNFAHALDIRAIRHVEFGTMTISPIPGSVVLDETTGTIAVGGGVLAPPEQGTFHRGEIQFTAPDNGLVSIFPTNPNVLLTGNNTSTGLVRFTPSVSLSSADVTPGEPVSILIGGAINFGSDTPADSYLGTFKITVSYI